MTTKLKSLINILFISIVLIGTKINAEEFVQTHEGQSLIKKEAILIIPGLNKFFHGTEKIKEFYNNNGYDLFIFDFKGRYSLLENQEKLELFYKKHRLNKYHSLHVLSYIVGAWILNPLIKKLPHENLKTIIYDRSPIQESIRELITHIPEGVNDYLFYGIIDDFTYTSYTPVSLKGVNIGIIIENRPTNMAKNLEKYIRKLGPLNFNPNQFSQNYNDYFYIWANHDDMYVQYEGIVPEVFYFIKHGHFSSAVKRKPVDADPFVLDSYLESLK
jgi:hypothetical protein